MGKEVSTGESEWIVGWPVVDWRGGNEGNEGKTACVHQQLYMFVFSQSSLTSLTLQVALQYWRSVRVLVVRAEVTALAVTSASLF